MPLRRLRDASSPWSLFGPVALAVFVGVLAAEFVSLSVSSILAGGRPATTQPVPPAAPEASMPTTQVAEDGASTVAVGAPLHGELPSLPGPSSARRDGDPRACINGTVVLRRHNGWEQGLEQDRPVRCIAASP